MSSISAHQKEGRVAPVMNPVLHDLQPYRQGKSELEGQAEPIKLSSNESPHGPSPRAITAYKEAATKLFRYPDGSQYALRSAIASVFDLNLERIVCGNGSEEMILLLVRAFLQPGDEVVVSEHAFAMAITHAVAQGARVVTAPEPELRPDTDAILSKVTDQTRMVILASPNNPVGQYLPAADLRRLHASLSPDVLLLIDGAYADYVDAEDFESGEALVDMYENVVTTRTFSKLYGLSGLRIGWAYMPDAIVDAVSRIRTPFNTNAAALAAAEQAVLDQPYALQMREHNARSLVRIRGAMEQIGITFIHSVANFYLLKFETPDKSAERACEHLMADGIIPRPVEAGGPENCLRITVGLDHENDAVIESLTDYMTGGIV